MFYFVSRLILWILKNFAWLLCGLSGRDGWTFVFSPSVILCCWLGSEHQITLSLPLPLSLSLSLSLSLYVCMYACVFEKESACGFVGGCGWKGWCGCDRYTERQRECVCVFQCSLLNISRRDKNKWCMAVPEMTVHSCVVPVGGSWRRPRPPLLPKRCKLYQSRRPVFPPMPFISPAPSWLNRPLSFVFIFSGGEATPGARGDKSE